MMCDELLSIPPFERKVYVEILQKFRPEDITYASVAYYIGGLQSVPSGWYCSYLTQTKKELTFFSSVDTMLGSPVSILDFPEIKADCSNLELICIHTETHEYKIEPGKISICGPDLPFTPTDLISAGVMLHHKGFIYTWSPCGGTPK